MPRRILVAKRVDKKRSFSQEFAESLTDESASTGLKFEFLDPGKMKVSMDIKLTKKYADKKSDTSGSEHESGGEEDTESTSYEIWLEEKEVKNKDGTEGTVYKICLKAASAAAAFLKKVLKYVLTKLIGFGN
ncbi:hypothetical protein MTO96_005651 [Rhipicephalus appendiculatus]